MSVPSHTWVHLFLLFPQTLILASDLNCVYNTRGILFCSWNAHNQYSTAPCNVSAKARDKRDISGSCTLSLNENPRHCAVRLIYNGKYNDNPLTVGHEVDMTVVCSSAQTKKIVTNTSFLPFDHVRLDPPESLNIKMTEDGNWTLTWLVISNHIINTETEVHYKPLKAPLQAEKILLLREKELSVLLRGLKPNTVYEAKIRVKAKYHVNEASWSYWSQPVQWKTPPKDTVIHVTTLILVTMVGGVLFVVTVMLIIFIQKRVKKIIWIRIPDPSSFFDPLMSDYKGNFQKWLSSPFPISSFSPETCPPDISRLDANWNKEEHHPKSLCEHTQETQTHKNIHCLSCVSNKGYFIPNCLIYDHVDHQGFQTVASHESLSSPTENMPFFHSDYLCAPLSIAGLGFHNKSFELDSPQRNIQLPFLVEEVMDIVDNHNECSPDLPVTEEIIENEENEEFIESPGACSTTALVFHDVQPSLHTFDSSAGYLSLNELHQKHAVHWK